MKFGTVDHMRARGSVIDASLISSDMWTLQSVKLRNQHHPRTNGERTTS